jgi:predicted DsbA family dithiol-disulfide isomerase
LSIHSAEGMIILFDSDYHNMNTTPSLPLTYYSDVLCVWAYIAQARVDEIARKFSKEVNIDYRFCSIFGDTAHKMEKSWSDRGLYEGFGNHVLKSVEAFPHVRVSTDIWKKCRPSSSMPAHLMLKAVQRVDSDRFVAVLNSIRSAFFEHGRDIAQWPVLCDIVAEAGIKIKDVQALVDSGHAHADLDTDFRDQAELMVQGSPSFILNEGRQKLYGNVGYSVIEANINELLRSPNSAMASWC